MLLGSVRLVDPQPANKAAARVMANAEAEASRDAAGVWVGVDIDMVFSCERGLEWIAPAGN